MGDRAEDSCGPAAPPDCTPRESSVEAVQAVISQVLDHELHEGWPNLARLSLALGVVEAAWTAEAGKGSDAELDPSAVCTALDQGLAQFEDWVMGTAAPLVCDLDTRAKVRAIAGAVWSRLQAKSFTKEVLHAQHLSSFVATLAPTGALGGVKRQLDCAGIATTVLCTCRFLSRAFPERHEDLAGIRMQVLGTKGGQRKGGKDKCRSIVSVRWVHG